MFLETLTLMAGSAGLVVASLRGMRWRRTKERRKQEALDLIQYGKPVVSFVSQSEERCPKCDAQPSLKNATFRISRSKWCACEDIPFGHFHCECMNNSFSFLGMKLPSGCGAKWIMRAKDESRKD